MHYLKCDLEYIMQTFSIDHSRSYVSKARLAKGTEALDSNLDAIMERENVKMKIRKMEVRNSEGRWTAVYFLGQDSSFLCLVIAQAGFAVVG